MGRRKYRTDAGAGIDRRFPLGLSRLAAGHKYAVHCGRGFAGDKVANRLSSKTFPGHLSIATGLHPTQHGVIDNYFCRSDRTDCYSMGKGRKDPSWLAGTPLWTLVEQQGGRASTFFWPESDAAFAGVLPSDYRAFDRRCPTVSAYSRLLTGLRCPPNSAPILLRFIFLWSIQRAIPMTRSARNTLRHH